MFTNFFLPPIKLLTSINCLLVVLCLSACGKCPNDPLEPMNRGIYAFNKFADKMFVKPTAHAYETFLPKFVQNRVCNFFQNLNTIPALINHTLQGKFCYASEAYTRLIINSSFGIGGLFDVAAKIPVRHAEFGETLAVWGYKKSTYLVLPIWGPSTIRDTIGRGVTFFMSVWPYIPEEVGYYLYAGNMLNTRVNLLKAEDILCTAAIDEYSFVRDLYFQQRCYEFTDGRLGTDEQVDILQGPPE